MTASQLTHLAELAAYAYPVLMSWLRRGLIYRYCADRGRPVHVTDSDREELAADSDQRLELALETVAKALTFFRDHVLLARRWEVDAGATLTTYFVGSCLLAFQNVFRRWQGERRRWRDSLAVEMINCPEDRGRASYVGVDPQDLVVGTETVLHELRGMPPATRDAAALVLDDHTFTEAAAQLGTTARAIEGRLYRYRQSATGR